MVNRMMNNRPTRQLFRSRRRRMIAGVAGGIADYFGIDPTIVRIGWVIAALVIPPLTLPTMLALYLACAFIIPPNPDETPPP